MDGTVFDGELSLKRCNDCGRIFGVAEVTDTTRIWCYDAGDEVERCPFCGGKVEDYEE